MCIWGFLSPSFSINPFGDFKKSIVNEFCYTFCILLYNLVLRLLTVQLGFFGLDSFQFLLMIPWENKIFVIDSNLRMYYFVTNECGCGDKVICRTSGFRLSPACSIKLTLFYSNPERSRSQQIFHHFAVQKHFCYQMPRVC